MKYEQIKALTNLSESLLQATECGGLDILNAHCKNPDSINDVCDSIDMALQENDGATSVADLMRLWDDLNKIPTVYKGTNAAQIEVPFLHFNAGTLLEDIWQWFENQNAEFKIGEITKKKLTDIDPKLNLDLTGKSKLEILELFGYAISSSSDRFIICVQGDPESFSLETNDKEEAIQEAYKHLLFEVDQSIGYQFPPFNGGSSSTLNVESGSIVMVKDHIPDIANIYDYGVIVDAPSNMKYAHGVKILVTHQGYIGVQAQNVELTDYRFELTTFAEVNECRIQGKLHSLVSAALVHKDLRVPKTESEWAEMKNDQVVYCPANSHKFYTKEDFLKLCDYDNSQALLLMEYSSPNNLPEEVLSEGRN